MRHQPCRCPKPAAALSTNGNTVFSDRARAVGSARLSGYWPQAGSPMPLGTMDHDAEARGLEIVRRRLAFAGLGAAPASTPRHTGAVRAVQARAAQVAASQGGHLTLKQHQQLTRTARSIRAAQLGDYIAAAFPVPTPTDDGTTLQDVINNNWPLVPGGAPATGPGAVPPPAAPAPASPLSGLMPWLAIGGAVYWLFLKK